MEQYSIIGAAGDTEYVEGELLGDQLIAMFPKISFVKDMRSGARFFSCGAGLCAVCSGLCISSSCCFPKRQPLVFPSPVVAIPASPWVDPEKQTSE